MNKTPKTALYVRALDIVKFSDNIKAFFDKFMELNAAANFDKVYLETHRDMVIPDDDTLLSIKKYLEQQGIEVSGGITVTVDEMDDFKTYCYSNSEHRKKIKSFVEKTARLFDEILFDDFFFTNCKCPLCIEKKRKLSWTDFRLEQMKNASKELVLKPAKSINPKVRVGIKYPNWYEHFPASGFNLKEQPPMYDFIYTGNETRDAKLNNQHLQPYQSYGITRYYENIKPNGNGGGWVDPAGAISIERYAQQIWLTLLAKAREITLFDFHSLFNPITPNMKGVWQNENIDFNYEKIAASYKNKDGKLSKNANMAVIAGKAIEYIKPVIHELGNPIGIKAYKPNHSNGEDFLHQYIGMIGMPMEMVPEFPEEELIFLNASAAKDKDILKKMQKHLLNGRKLFITTGLIKELQSNGFSEIAEVEYTLDKLMIDTLMIGWEPVGYKTARPIIVPKIRTMTNDVWEEVSAIGDMSGTSMLASLKYGNGVVYLLNIPDNYSDLYALPRPVLNKIRQVICHKHLPVYLLDAPSKVSLMLYDNKTFCISSFLDEPVTISVAINKKTEGIEDLMKNKRLCGQPNKDGIEVSIRLPAQGIKVYRVI